MSQTNTNTNNDQNRNQIFGIGWRVQRSPNNSGRDDRRNDRGNNSIAEYSIEGKMKDGPISKLTITKTGHRPSQFKKISDALSVLCTNKNYQGLNEVLRTGHDWVKTGFMPDYLDANRWSTTHHVQISTVNPEAHAEPDESRPVLFQTM